MKTRIHYFLGTTGWLSIWIHSGFSSRHKNFTSWHRTKSQEEGSRHKALFLAKEIHVIYNSLFSSRVWVQADLLAPGNFMAKIIWAIKTVLGELKKIRHKLGCVWNGCGSRRYWVYMAKIHWMEFLKN